MIALTLCASSSWALDPMTENLWRLRYQVPGIGQPEKAASELDWASLPPSVDMRKEMEDLQVNFIQQGNRNSCAVFSATSVLEFQQRRLGNEIDISEQYTLWAAQKAGADPSVGLTIHQLAMAFDLYKVCREEVMPYKSGEKIVEPTDLAVEDARNMPAVAMDQIVEFEGRVGQTPEDIYRICKTLAKSQLVCLASEWGDSKSTLNGQNELIEGPMAGGHMIVLTGYELSPTNPMEGFFLLRNSWGMSWGDFGYAKMPFSYARKHAMEAVTFRFQSPAETKAALAVAAAVQNPAADSLAGYVFLRSGIGLVSAVLAVSLMAWLLAKSQLTARNILLYILGSAVCMVSLTVLSGMLVRRLATGEIAWIVGLCISFGGLFYRWIQATGKRFQLEIRPASGFLLGALLLWNALGWAGNRYFPTESFQTWRSALHFVSPISVFKLVEGTSQQRATFLKISQAKPILALKTPSDVEKKWLLAWSGELRQELSMLRRDRPLAVGYYQRRVASYEQSRRAYLVKNSGATLVGLTPDPAPTQKAERDQRLWKMYQALQKEKTALDPQNPVAVAAFNQKAAEYRSLKASQISDKPVADAAND